MKKLILVMICTVLCISGAKAQKMSYIEEMQALGAVSGQGLACEATKYHTFEMLARAILVSKANSDEQQLEGMKAYNEHKVEAFISKIKDGFYNCRSIVSTFDKQKIFSMVLYGDGTIKMPDGSIITPRNPYDPNLVYQKDNSERQQYMDIYNEQVKKLRNNPAYKKVLREQQMRNGF